MAGRLGGIDFVTSGTPTAEKAPAVTAGELNKYLHLNGHCYRICMTQRSYIFDLLEVFPPLTNKTILL